MKLLKKNTLYTLVMNYSGLGMIIPTVKTKKELLEQVLERTLLC